MIRPGCAVLLLLALSVVAAARAQPMTVTTDTPEYCATLAQRLTAKPVADERIRTMIADGRRMCATGHVRGGVAMLRHCVMMLGGQL